MDFTISWLIQEIRNERKIEIKFSPNKQMNKKIDTQEIFYIWNDNWIISLSEIALIDVISFLLLN
jgi:hypothetical protein